CNQPVHFATKCGRAPSSSFNDPTSRPQHQLYRVAHPWGSELLRSVAEKIFRRGNDK
ncbi:unnamed protein product, partial [Choristocarpus tenellus]